jgi:SAM-dependent methyltransferase
MSKGYDPLVRERAYFSGEQLYGDDLTGQDLADWFASEESGYHDIRTQQDIRARQGEYVYGFHYVNYWYGYRHLAGRRFQCALALGCAKGDDIGGIASQVERIVAIEPAREWWHDSIAGTPTVYMAPQVSGDIDLPAGVVDLAIAFGTLHHIPNVSHTIAELSRVMVPGGVLLLREPVSSMGDWRKPRPGSTRNERGIPVEWMVHALAENGFHLKRAALCIHPLIFRIARVTHAWDPFNSRAFVWLDAALSGMTGWNRHYFRDRLWKKVAPGVCCYFAERK